MPDVAGHQPHAMELGRGGDEGVEQSDAMARSIIAPVKAASRATSTVTSTIPTVISQESNRARSRSARNPPQNSATVTAEICSLMSLMEEKKRLASSRPRENVDENASIDQDFCNSHRSAKPASTSSRTLRTWSSISGRSDRIPNKGSNASNQFFSRCCARYSVESRANQIALALAGSGRHLLQARFLFLGEVDLGSDHRTAR